MFTSKNGNIKKFSSSSGKVDDVDIININSTKPIKVFKSAKTKNLIKPKKPRIRFFIYGAMLVFTKLRQMFIKVLIVHHFDLEYYI